MDIESPRRTSSATSPEFDFWSLSNNPDQLHPPNLLTADELFVDGVLLPLHLLSLDPKPEAGPEPESKPEPDPEPESQQPPGPTAQESSICSSNPSSSKRWKDIFKKKEPSSSPPAPAAEEKEKKKEKKSNGGGGAAELNINIWPFSRSRSAGTAGGRRKAAAAMRKSSSAPCSRSNSRGENTVPAGRRWAQSPGRAGVHVGRASPVWQVKRAPKGPKEGKKPRGLNSGLSGLGLNVNSCIGYGHQVGCRAEGGEGNSGSMFRFRALFSKKVY